MAILGFRCSFVGYMNMLRCRPRPYPSGHGSGEKDLLHTYRLELNSVDGRACGGLRCLRGLVHRGLHWHSFDGLLWRLLFTIFWTSSSGMSRHKALSISLSPFDCCLLSPIGLDLPRILSFRNSGSKSHLGQELGSSLLLGWDILGYLPSQLFCRLALYFAKPVHTVLWLKSKSECAQKRENFSNGEPWWLPW